MVGKVETIVLYRVTENESVGKWDSNYEARSNDPYHQQDALGCAKGCTDAKGANQNASRRHVEKLFLSLA